MPHEEAIKGLPKLDLRRRHDEQMAVVDAAREVVRAVRLMGGGDGGSNWFPLIAKLMEALDALDGKPE